jgi:hypothetical protein
LNPNPSRAASLAVLAGLCLAAAAHAEPGRWPPTYFQAGIGAGLAATETHDSNQGLTDVMLGFRFNQNIGVQAVGFQINSVAHRPSTPGAPLYDFERYVGVQVVGFIPCTPYWDIFGEIGGGQSRFTSATPGAGSQEQADGLVGAGIRWQITDHVAVSLDAVRLWDARVNNGTLRAEFNF